MNRVLATAALALAALFVGPALAHGPQEIQVRAWVVDTHVSEPGESRDAFVLRVAGEMQRWTDETGNEACAYLATDGNRWGVRVSTQNAQVLCYFADELVPEGMTASGDTIHSHPTPQNGHLLITAETKDALRAVGDRALLKQVKAMRGRLRVQVDGFSPHDYLAGPGYLVVSGRVLYQQGKGTAREVGTVANYTLAAR